MKYIFSLLFGLFFSFSAIATECPKEKPFQDLKGNCYSCEDDRTFVRYPKDIAMEEDVHTIQYKGKCTDTCPNRIEYSDGWLDAQHFCATDTFKNRVTAHITSHLMSIMFNPFNWVNFFVIWFFLSQILLWIFKKYTGSRFKNIIKILTVIPALILAFVFFLDNLIFSLIGVSLLVIIKLQKAIKTDKHFGKNFWNFIRIVILILIIFAFIMIVYG